MFDQRYLPLFCAAGMWTLGCSCGSDPNVQKNPPPPSPESGFSANCSCIIHLSTPAGNSPEIDTSTQVCLPQSSVDAGFIDAGGFCSGPFTEYTKTSILMLAEKQDNRACRQLTIDATCLAAPATPQDNACQGTCPVVDCTTTNCTQDQLLNGACPCTVPTACNGFGASAICTPNNVQSLDAGTQAFADQQSGAETFLVAHSGTWDHSTSSLKVSATVQVACVKFLGCLTASDTETSPASGSFQLLGKPCPGTSCNVGLSSQIHVDDFSMNFSVGPVSESANPRNILVFARAPLGSIPIGPDGHGIIPAGTLVVQATADEGSDHWVASNKTNTDDLPLFIDWASHTVHIENFAVNFPDSSGIVNLNGTFGPSVAESLDSVDSDGDGVPDIHDNCIAVPNPDQHVVPNPVLGVPSNTASCQEPVTGSATAQDVCNLLPVTITNDAPPDFAPGETAVHWTATDVFGDKTTLVQLVEQQPSIVAKNGILIDDRAATAATGAIPTMVALGSQGVKIGTDAVVGDVFSVGAITIGDRSKALGTLVSQGTITPGNGVVTAGTRPFSPVVTGTFPDFSHPPVVTGSTDVALAPDSSRTLTPGHYRALTVNSRATLTLLPGTYSFTSVDFEPSSTVILSGATELDLTASLIWRGAVTLSPGTPLPIVFYSGTSQIVMEANGSLHLIAPNASVVLGAGSSLTFNGTIAASSVEVRPDVMLTCQPESI